MKLYIKQKVFSLKSRSSIYDAEGNEAYYSEAMIPSIGTKLKIYDRSGAELIYIEQKFWSFLPKYKIFKDGAEIAEVVKDFTFFKPKYTVDFKSWQINGDLWEWDYTVTDSRGATVATAYKEIFNLSDTYAIDVADEKDAAFVLMIVLAIDADKSQRN